MPESSDPRLVGGRGCGGGTLSGGSHSGLGVISTSGIRWRAESRLRLRWWSVTGGPAGATWQTGGSIIPIDL